MAFLVFESEAAATRARDLRAKAEGYPQPGTLRGVDYAREPLGSRFSLESDEDWAVSFLPTRNGVQLLTDDEIAEIEGALAAIVVELPSDWQHLPEDLPEDP